MSKKDYNTLAKITGETLGAAYLYGGEEARTAVYDALYRPLVKHFNEDNELFKPLMFAAAVGRAEGTWVRENGPGPDGCEGHPAGLHDPMGQTVYCDGTCKGA
jgi:hypothetical protein